MSKLTCTLNRFAPLKGLLVEGASITVSIRRSIWKKLSIIVFLYCMRDSSRNDLIEYLTLSSPFYLAMGGCLGWREWYSPSDTISRPNYLYPDLVVNIHRETIKEHIVLTLLILIYVRMKWKNIYRTINTDILQWKQRFNKHLFY